MELVKKISVPQSHIFVDQEEEVKESVMGFFKADNVFRQFFVMLGKQWWFDAMVFTAIIVSCIFLMLAPPNEVWALPNAPDNVFAHSMRPNP